MPQNLPATNMPLLPYQRGGGGGGGANTSSNVINKQRRSWSEEHTTHEDEKEAWNTMSSSNHHHNNSHGSNRHHQHRFHDFREHHFEAYAAPESSAYVVRTGPLYLALVLFCTIPMLFMSISSIQRIPKPPSLDGDPRFGMKQVPQHQQVDFLSATFEQQGPPQQQHYLGRPFSWRHHSFDQVTTIHETPTARCILGSMTSLSKSKPQQNDHGSRNGALPQLHQQIMLESLDMVVVAIQDSRGQWLVWQQEEEKEDGLSDIQEQHQKPVIQFLSGTVQNIYEAPWAAAHRLVQQHVASLVVNHQTTTPPSASGQHHVSISLDALGLPLGSVPSQAQSQWTFLGRSSTMTMNGGPLVFSYLYRLPAGSTIDTKAVAATRTTTTTNMMQQHPLPEVGQKISKWILRQLDPTTLTIAWRSGQFLDIMHAHTASLSLHHMTPRALF